MSRAHYLQDHIRDAISAPGDIHARFKEALPLLVELVGADYGALFAPSPDSPGEGVWSSCHLPPAFLSPRSYEQMREHDFVASAVGAKPGLVLSDAEMIARPVLMRHPFYHFAREVYAPIERLLAVMLHVGNFQCGLSIYRAKLRPFSDRARNHLQRLTQAMINAVQCGHLQTEGARANKRLECLFLGEETGTLLYTKPKLAEIDRTPKATRLLDTWFPGRHRETGGMPPMLSEALAQAQIANLYGKSDPLYRFEEGKSAVLQVKVHPWIEGIATPAWRVTLREVPHVPIALRTALKGRPLEVCSLVLRGLTDKEIGNELRIEPNTVKKHARSMYRLLKAKGFKVNDRHELQALALRYG